MSKIVTKHRVLCGHQGIKTQARSVLFFEGVRPDEAADFEAACWTSEVGASTPGREILVLWCFISNEGNENTMLVQKVKKFFINKQLITVSCTCGRASAKATGPAVLQPSHPLAKPEVTTSQTT